MTFPDLLANTFRTLWAHKLRTALTMFGIAWGIVSITLMVAAGEGLRVGHERVQEEFAKNLLIIHGGRTSLQAGGQRAGRRIRWTASDHLKVQPEATACEYVIPELGRSGLTVKSRFNSGALRVTGSLPPFATIRSIPVAEGRFYNREDVEQARRVAFLGTDAKKQLFAAEPALGQTVHLAGRPYTVVGVMEHKDQDSSYDGSDVSKVFIPFSAMLRDFPNPPPAKPNEIQRLLVSPASLAEHERCKPQTIST